MKKIFWQCMLPLVLGAITACRKEEKSIPKSSFELLTQKEWILSSIGFDDNNNGNIDTNEESIKDCEKDNTIQFNIDGKGFFSDRMLDCSGQQEGDFSWSLVNYDSVLNITGVEMSILKLDENEFVYTPKMEGIITRFIVRYRH